MGREIFYCWKCANRIESSAFAKKKAFRYQDKISCDECVFELVADLSAEEQERILAGDEAEAAEAPTPRPRKSGTGTIKRLDPEGLGGARNTGAIPRKRTGQTDRIPKVEGPSKRMTRGIPKAEPGEEIVEGEVVEGDPAAKKRKILMLSGVGGGALVLIVALILLFAGGKKKPAPPAATTEVTAAKTPKTPAKPNEPGQAAKTALLEVTNFEKSQPEAWGELVKKWREVEQLAKGTDLAADAQHSIEVLLARLEKAAAALDEQVKPQFGGEEFKAVLDTLAAEQAKHDVPEWKDAIARKIDQYKGIMADRWRTLKAKAEEARANNEAAELEKLAAVVGKWALKDYIEEFTKIAAATPDAPATPARPPATPGAKPAVKAAVKPVFSKPLSPDMQAFLPGWQRAAGMAFNRDYDGAVAELGKAAKAVDSDEVRKAASEDADAIRAAGEFLMNELVKAASGIKRLSTVTVEYLHAPGVWKEVTGRAARVDAGRLELKITITDEKEKKTREEIRFVEFADLSADTLGSLLKAQKKSLDKKESLAIALLCFLEGDLEAGRGYAGGQAVSERFLVWSGEAREAAPKSGGRDLEARDLFHQHDLEWRKKETWGPAMEKAKTLINDFSTARIVRANQALLTKRMSTGKDYTFLPTDLKALGDSNTFQLKKDELVWVTSKDIDFNESLNNYVDAEFYALPNTKYRAWIYVGGCCQPVFGALYQTTEGVINHKGKEQGINPGDNVAPPIPMASNLKKTHEEHKPKGAKENPKTPARWAWISLPLPREYASPGPKTIRLLTDQAGFGIKYVIVSSTRTTMPDAAAQKELDAQAQAALTAAPADALGPKGAPQAKEWLVIGPFDNKLGQAEEPEKDIDPKKEVKGKGGNVKWKRFDAAVTGANAVLEWSKGKTFNPTDNSAAYALIHVKAPQSMDAQLILTHDDGGKAWVNGTRVHENDRTGGFKADEFKIRVKLEEGWNRLLFKIRNGTTNFGLQVRLVDGAGGPIPGIEWHPYGDALAP